MTARLKGTKISVQLNTLIQNVLADGTIVSGPLTFLGTKSLVSGDDANQANRGWGYSGTIPSGSSINIDLRSFAGFDLGAGNGCDANGQPLTLQDVVVIIFKNTNAVGAAGLLEVTPGASNGWNPIGSHTQASGGALQGQGTLARIELNEPALLVTDLSRNIKLKAVGGDVAYTVALIGRDEEEESSSSSSISSASSSLSSSSQS